MNPTTGNKSEAKPESCKEKIATRAAAEIFALHNGAIMGYSVSIEAIILSALTRAEEGEGKEVLAKPETLTPQGQSSEETGEAFWPWVPPFKYVELGAVIVDAAQHRVVDIRDWGFLTGLGSGALGLNALEADRIQNKLGILIADLLNAQSAALIPSRDSQPLAGKETKTGAAATSGDERQPEA